jgi:tripartite ATP-independent transporter DctM subunit
MPNEMVGVIGFIALLVLMFLKIPLGVAFTLIGGAGTIILKSYGVGISTFDLFPYSWSKMYSFSCLPMFVLLGIVAARTGTAKDLYSATHQWVGRLPGGLAMATLIVTAFFSAISGSAVASVATIATTCYPEMKRYGYEDSLATGCITAGASMDIMIPPSIPMIIYGMIAEVSIGTLFLAGFVPGFLEVIVFGVIIYIMVKRNPSLAPLSTEARASFMEKVKRSRGVLPTVIIFLLVFGGMFAGVFTPTEAGAMGVLAAIIVSLVMKRLQGQVLKNALIQTARLTGTVFMILIGVAFFNTFVTLSGLPEALSKWIVNIGMHPLMFLIVVSALYFPLGALMDEISMMLLTVPFFLPTAKVLGIDPVYFGILIILAWQVGFIAPPVAMLVFVTHSVIPEVPIGKIYKGCLPYLLGLAIVELLILLVPAIVFVPLKFMK